MVRMMKKQFKRSLAAGLCLAMLLSGGGMLLAADAGTQDTVTTYTLDEIKTLSGIHATSVLTQKADNEITEAGRFSAEMDYYDALYAAMSGNPGAEPMIQVARMAYDNAIENSESAKDALEEVQLQAQFEGESRYFAYLELEDSLLQMQKTLALQEELLRIERVKLGLGMTTQMAVDKIALQVSELKTSFANMQSAKILAGFELMNEIGQPENTPFKLEEVTEYPWQNDYFLYESLSEKAYENSLTLKQLDRAIQDLKDDVDENLLTTPVQDQMAAQEGKLILTRTQFSYTLKVLAQNGINELALSSENLAYLKGKAVLAQTGVAQNQIMIQLGAAAPYTAIGSALDLVTAQNSYEKALHDRYLTLRRLNLLQQGVAVSASIGGGSAS